MCGVSPTAESRIKMHLESRGDQHVRITAANLALDFAKCGTIHTENGYKLPPRPSPVFSKIRVFDVEQSWTDERGWYALTLGRIR